MSERRLKLGHRKEYKRKSKHTRNPSYYPRHLTKVTLADFDADFNLRISKEVAAQRGYGRKVLDKSCHIAWDRSIIAKTSYTDCNRYLLVCPKCGKLKRKRV